MHPMLSSLRTMEIQNMLYEKTPYGPCSNKQQRANTTLHLLAEGFFLPPCGSTHESQILHFVNQRLKVRNRRMYWRVN